MILFLVVFDDDYSQHMIISQYLAGDAQMKMRTMMVKNNNGAREGAAV